MPHFYFHLDTPEGREPDEIGIACRDLDHAYLEACRAVPGLVVEIARRGGAPLRHAFVIADAAGVPVLSVPFAEPLRAEPWAPPGQSARTRRLCQEIAAVIEAAHETTRRTRAIVARARAS